MKIIKKINRYLAYISDIFLVGMMVITVLDVIGSFFRHPITGAEEIVGFLASLMIAFALPISHQEKAHIGVDILYLKLSKKGRKINDLITQFFLSIFFFITGYVCFKYGLYIKKVGTVSPTLQIPFYYIIFMISLNFFVLSITILIEFLSLLKGDSNG